MVFSPVSYNQKGGLAFQKCIQALQKGGNRMVTEAGRRPELREEEEKKYTGGERLSSMPPPPVSPSGEKWKEGRSQPFFKCIRENSPCFSTMANSKPKAKLSGSSWACRIRYIRDVGYPSPNQALNATLEIIYALSTFNKKPHLSPDVHL